MGRFAECLQFILRWEGGVFTDDPLDAGGPTKWGVIQARYDEYRKSAGLPLQSVRNITDVEVESIYRTYYWEVIGGDALPVPLDLAVMNIAVNSGPGRATRWVNALVESDPLAKARALCDRYEAFYHGIVERNPSQQKFLRGWLNRLEDCRKEIEEAAESEEPTWALLLGDKPLGPAWANPHDSGRAYFPARALLEAILGKQVVSGALSVINGQLCWSKRAMPVKEIEREPGQMWAAVRDVAQWAGLDVVVDGGERTIRLVRSPAAAKASIGHEAPDL